MEKKYSEKEVEELFEKATREKGAVLALLHFDAHGKDEETVRNSLIDFVDRMTKEKGVVYCKGEIGEVLKKSDESYSTYAEVKVLVASFSDLLNLSLKYGPVAVEILSPSEIRLELDEAHALLLDASRSTQDYVEYIMKKVLKPEDFAKFREQLKYRAEVGKKLMEKSGKLG